MGSRPSARRALISFVLVGALTGCGDEPAEQAPTPTAAAATETSPAPEPSPTPTPLATSIPLPVMPPEMASNDAAGAEAAARYFVDLINFTYTNRDVTLFEEFSEDDCVFCNEVVDEIERMHAEGVRREGGQLDVVSLRANEYFPTTDSRFVTLELHEAPGRFVDSDGAILTESDVQQYAVDFVLAWNEGSWVLVASGDSE